MNIEIANRLFELRKQKNLSQEDLAAQIGVSRQAVSKWERAESSPDTDNLIELARLYEISLDELLFTCEPTKKPEVKENGEFVSISLSGIHVIEKDGSEVQVGWKGIRVKNNKNPDYDENFEESWDEIKVDFKKRLAFSLPIPLLVAAAYLIMGFRYNLWHPGWMVFFSIPIYFQIVSMFFVKGIRRKLNAFPTAILCVTTYLILGFCYELWHPTWILFMVIPLYHSFVNAIWKNN